jgi:cytochrome c-type biogenesis protein CcsB
MALLAIGFIEHALGLSIRWILAERGPFSNMYESFVFAIGGMILTALVLECSRMVRLAGLGAAILGFAFMVIAHKAPIFDSQIRPLVPALQSSWLTYHVVVIMLSYSAFVLSFFISLVYLAKDKTLGGDAGTNLLARQLPSLRSLDIFNYRILAIGFPLLTLGIILGAIWAATAWGRPWGFDPKETWSAITWLIYAVYFHVRFMGGWGGRSCAIISVVGFLAVLFTYLGVNYLLPGLHSYV